MSATVKGYALIVDDEPDICELLSIPLRGIGFEVTTAPGIREGLEILKDETRPFTIILSDLKTPTGDGRELLAYAREHRPTVPVIFVTAYASEVKDALLAAGARLVLPKPLRLSYLLSEVQSVMGTS
jgi:two-component system, NtrC family, response regulator PilR